MKISLRWLQDYVDVEEFFSRPEDLGELLTHIGLEIENIENQSKRWNRVVVGCVEKLGKHPQADRLTLCQVDVGEGSLRPIVCGAKNHKQGDKVVVALPGASSPRGFEDSKIQDSRCGKSGNDVFKFRVGPL